MSKSKIEITKIHFGASLFQVDYKLNGKPMMASDEQVAESFDKAMQGLVSHAIDIKELPKEAAKPYRCNALSLSCASSKKGDSRGASISVTKVTATGKADNMSTAHCLYETHNSKAQVLPQKTVLDIKNAMVEAKKFITGHRDLTELYSQPDLATAV